MCCCIEHRNVSTPLKSVTVKIILLVILLSNRPFCLRNSMSETVRLVSGIAHPGPAAGVYETTQHFNDIKEHLHIVKRDIDSLAQRSMVSSPFCSSVINYHSLLLGRTDVHSTENVLTFKLTAVLTFNIRGRMTPLWPRCLHVRHHASIAYWIELLINCYSRYWGHHNLRHFFFLEVLF